MTLESVDYINDLNADYPQGSSTRTESDDHLRLIKKAVVATFPTVSATVAASHTDLNTLAGNSALVGSRLVAMNDRLAFLAAMEPVLSASISAAHAELAAFDTTLPLREVFRGTMTVSQSVYTFGSGTFTGANRLTAFLERCDATATFYFRVGPAAGVVSSGYVGLSMQVRAGDTTPLTYTPTNAAMAIDPNGAAAGESLDLKIVLERITGHTWMCQVWGSRVSSIGTELLFCTSTFTLADELDQLQFSTPGSTMPGATARPVAVSLWAEDLP